MTDSNNNNQKNGKPEDTGLMASHNWDTAKRARAARGAGNEADKPSDEFLVSVHPRSDTRLSVSNLLPSATLERGIIRGEELAHRIYSDPRFEGIAFEGTGKDRKQKYLGLTGQDRNDGLVNLLNELGVSAMERLQLEAAGILEKNGIHHFDKAWINHDAIADAAMSHIQRLERTEGVPKESVVSRMLAATLEAFSGIARSLTGGRESPA